MLETLFEIEHLPMASLVACSGVVLFFQGFRHLRSARRVENTPTARIRSLPLGTVEIRGTATSAEPIAAPLSGKPVAYYEVEVEEYRRRKNHSSWVTVHREASDEPFGVDDGTGVITVLPDGAETHLPVDFQHEAVRFSDLPSDLEAKLSSWNVRRGLFGGNRLRLTERHVDLGSAVYVYGVAQEHPHLRRVQAERVNEKLRDLKSDPETMRTLDFDGDGNISHHEWDHARTRAAGEARDELEADRVVIARGHSGEMFLISDHDEGNLVSSLRWRALGFVFGGAALTVGAAGYLIYSTIGLG
jgi:hypothetical protein